MVHAIWARWLLGAGILLLPHGGGEDGWWSRLFDEKVVPLEKLLQNPEPFRGMKVAFVIQFHRLGTIENPYFTRFDDDWYLNFSAWPDSAPLWNREVYRRDFPCLFVRRGTDLASAITAAPVYSRWVVIGEVADIFKGVPWIEATQLRRLELSLTEPSLVRMVKGLTLKEHRRFDAAAQEFRLADHEALPLAVRTLVMREEAECLERAGRADAARLRREEALRVWPEDPHLAASKEPDQPSRAGPAPGPGPRLAQPARPAAGRGRRDATPPPAPEVPAAEPARIPVRESPLPESQALPPSEDAAGTTRESAPVETPLPEPELLTRIPVPQAVAPEVSGPGHAPAGVVDPAPAPAGSEPQGSEARHQIQGLVQPPGLDAQAEGTPPAPSPVRIHPDEAPPVPIAEDDRVRVQIASGVVTISELFPTPRP
jgi:hypothetical protein